MRTMDPRFIDDLAMRLSRAVPESLQGMTAEAEQAFRSVLTSALGRMNLVTREEFDVQVAVLKRTREMLERLEARLGDLEGK